MSLTAYRATRFIIEDDLIEKPRTKLKFKILAPEAGVPKSPFRVKVVDLLECPYCMSVWVTAGVFLATWAFTPIALPALSWGATCGAVMAWWRLIEPD